MHFDPLKQIRQWAKLCPCVISLAIASPSTAEVVSTPRSCESFSPQPNTIHSSRKICRTGLTSPSLWWIREQVGSQLGRKLVSNWKTAPTDVSAEPKVILTVNSQAWSLLDYFERYEFLHAFGLVAQDFGYVLEVEDTRGVAMAAYRCEEGEGLCRIEFSGSGSGFRGGNRRLF